MGNNDDPIFAVEQLHINGDDEVIAVLTYRAGPNVTDQYVALPPMPRAEAMDVYPLGARFKLVPVVESKP